MGQRDAVELQRIAARNPAVLAWWAVRALLRAILDFLNRLGRHWFMLLVLLGGVCLAIRGTILLDYGFAFLFREDRQLHGFWPGTLLHSPSFFTELFAVLLAGAAWVFAVDLDRTRQDINSDPDAVPHKSSARGAKADFHWELPQLSIWIFLLGIPPWLALNFPASPVIPALQPGEFARAGLGWIIGFILTLTVLSLAQVIEVQLAGRPGARKTAKKGLTKAKPSWRRRVESWVDWDNLIWRVIILWLMYIVTWVGLVAMTVIPELRLPTVAIFALVGLALAGYVALNFLVERMRFYAVIGVLGLVAFIHRDDPFGYRFADLGKHYQDCTKERGDAAQAAATALDPDWCGKPRKPAVAQHASLALVDTTEAMDRPIQPLVSLNGFGQWQSRQHHAATATLPKLVVVAISGGAYRAAFWGALVLDRLRKESASPGKLEGFAGNIRLLTGASGGMVAAAYFANLKPEQLSHADSASLVQQISSDIAEAGDKTSLEHSQDSLSPITRQLVRHDIFNAFSPQSSFSDRGVALEAQWKSLDRSFASLRQDERDGLRPSLIFAPMIAETGQPLLISNLDLSGISSAGDFQPLELFAHLPEAAGELKLSTAVRMSATFPFVTPSAGLPTRPALHVLDAGYLDNYGVGVALGYLKQREVVEWIANNTSGVILVQINAFPANPSSVGAHTDACSDSAGGASGDALSRALSAVASPLNGLFSSRGASMRFRNDQEFETLKQLFAAAPNGKPVSLERVVFENTARASFSWYLPKQDLDCMKKELDAPEFNQRFNAQLGQLAKYWTAAPLAPKAPLAAIVPRAAASPTLAATDPPTTSTIAPLAAKLAPVAADDDPVPPEPVLDPMP